MVTVQTTLYTIYCTLYNLHCTLYKIYSTIYAVKGIIYTINSTFYTLHCALYTQLYNQYCTAQCTALHNALSILQLHQKPSPHSWILEFFRLSVSNLLPSSLAQVYSVQCMLYVYHVHWSVNCNV